MMIDWLTWNWVSVWNRSSFWVVGWLMCLCMNSYVLLTMLKYCFITSMCTVPSIYTFNLCKIVYEKHSWLILFMKDARALVNSCIYVCPFYMWFRFFFFGFDFIYFQYHSLSIYRNVCDSMLWRKMLEKYWSHTFSYTCFNSMNRTYIGNENLFYIRYELISSSVERMEQRKKRMRKKNKLVSYYH